jgi:hypothetical protein
MCPLDFWSSQADLPPSYRQSGVIISWNNPDPGIAEIEDAKKRVAGLKGEII